MRSLTTVPLLLVALARGALAVEASADLATGKGFLWMVADVKQSFADDAFTVGAGYALASDLRRARHGARASIGVDLDAAALDLALGYAPPQDGRGWATGELTVTQRLARERIAVENELVVALRRADLDGTRAFVPVEQLHLSLGSVMTVDERWDLALHGVASFYDANLARRGLRRADAGPLISVAGAPERWALLVDGGWRWLPHWHGAIGVGAIEFADGRGGAWLPRAALRAGPFAGVTVEVGVDVVVPWRARAGPVEPIGSLGIEVAP